MQTKAKTNFVALSTLLLAIIGWFADLVVAAVLNLIFYFSHNSLTSLIFFHSALIGLGMLLRVVGFFFGIVAAIGIWKRTQWAWRFALAVNVVLLLAGISHFLMGAVTIVFSIINIRLLFEPEVKRALLSQSEEKFYKEQPLTREMKVHYIFYTIGVVFIIASVWYFAKEFVAELPNSIKTALLVISVLITFALGEVFRGLGR
ncbi:hypothetical protein D6817_02205 [Candidatus Pacearchaeota archaeon]|nr:MAG: hypothetical protein D6817_02205 [Candidatus Pacearchaeota archaeon]